MEMRRYRLVLLLAAVCGAGWGQTGRIDGWVLTGDGKPVNQGIVWIAGRSNGAGGASPSFHTAVKTGADGSFHVAGVPAGNYAVCPEAPDGNWVGPCAWEAEPSATVGNVQGAVIAPIVLKPAVEFYVRVNDGKGTRKAKEGKVAG